MKSKLSERVVAYLFLAFLSPLFLVFSSGAAARDSVSIPENAHLTPSGRGWECDRGYRKTSKACESLVVPENAYLAFSGHDWRCSRGYRKSGVLRVALEVPANAYLNAYGDNWKCERGYQREGNRCVLKNVSELWMDAYASRTSGEEKGTFFLK